MKAILMDGYGGPEMLRLGETPLPVAGDGEVLIRVTAVGVNPADPKWRTGMFKAFAPLTFPHVPGYDVAGVVEQAPAGGPVAKGTRVAAMLHAFRQGAYAEYAVMSAAEVGVLPEELSDQAAAAIPTPGLTGVQLVEEHLDVQPGQTVLITGAVRWALRPSRGKSARRAHRGGCARKPARGSPPARRGCGRDARRGVALGADRPCGRHGGRRGRRHALSARAGGRPDLHGGDDPDPRRG